MKTETASRKIKMHRYLNAFGFGARVDRDGTVRVWDSVADHYTTCHSLTEAQVRHFRAYAR